MSNAHESLPSNIRFLEETEWDWNRSLKQNWWLWCFFVAVPLLMLLLCCFVCSPSTSSKSEKKRRKEEQKRVQQALEQQQQLQQQESQPMPTVVQHYNVVPAPNPAASKPSNAGNQAPDYGAGVPPPVYVSPPGPVPPYYVPPPVPHYGPHPPAAAGQHQLQYSQPPQMVYPEPNLYGHYYGVPPPAVVYDTNYPTPPPTASNDSSTSRVTEQPRAQAASVADARTQRESELNQRKCELETQVQLLSAALHNREVYGAVSQGPSTGQEPPRRSSGYPSAP